MLRKSLKISDTSKTEFFVLKFFQSGQKYDKTTAVKISAVFRTFYGVYSP